jgi:hypothetical protein
VAANVAASIATSTTISQGEYVHSTTPTKPRGRIVGDT